MLPDYYATLNISSAASLDEIRRAFRDQACRHHPDRGGSHERMVKINEAYQILSNPKKRNEYDAARRTAAPHVIVVTAEQNTYHAKREAQNYPQQWEEFETWMNSLIADFKRAEEGRTWHVFRYAGVAVGICLVALLRKYYAWQEPWFFNYVIILACGGIGILIHAATGASLGYFARIGSPPTVPPSAFPRHPPPPPFRRSYSQPPPRPRSKDIMVPSPAPRHIHPNCHLPRMRAETSDPSQLFRGSRDL